MANKTAPRFAHMNRNQHINSQDRYSDAQWADYVVHGYSDRHRSFAQRNAFAGGKQTKTKKVCTVKGF